MTTKIVSILFSKKNKISIPVLLMLPFFLGASLKAQDLIITGVIDGPLSGGLPKAVEMYAIHAIPDLSIYGIGFANNGGGTDGQEYTLSGSASAGDYLYVAVESSGFQSFLGFAPTFTSGAASINGDDAIELFQNNVVIDVFGDVDVDGTGQVWEYMDGWAYRNSGSSPHTVFTPSEWTFSTPNALDGETVNASATTPFPVSTFSSTVSVTISAAKDLISQGAIHVAGDQGPGDYYGSGNDDSFAEYGIASFTFRNLDFGLSGAKAIDSIKTATLTLTHNDRTFSDGTQVEFFLTTDVYAGNYAGLTFDPVAGPINGINSAQFSAAPVSLGVFPYTPLAGGVKQTFSLDFNGVESAVLAKLAAGEEFSIIIAAVSADADVTFSGLNNTFDPGNPNLELVVTAADITDSTPPGVSVLSPADDSVGHSISGNLSIAFDELVQLGSGNISIYRQSDDQLIEAIDVTMGQVSVDTLTATVTIDPSANLEVGTFYYVQIDPSAVQDVSGNAFPGISDQTSWNFGTTVSPIDPLDPTYAVSQYAVGGNVVGDLNPLIVGTEGIRYAMIAGSGAAPMMKPIAPGYSVTPIHTAGDMLSGTSGALNSMSVGDYAPPGIFDGIGGYLLDANTVRIFVNHDFVNHEIGASEGGPSYQLENGTTITKGARVSYFDIDITTRSIVDGGLAFRTIYDRQGNIVTNAGQIDGGSFDRLCSASLYEPEQFGVGRGLVDRIFFTGEEASTEFAHPHGGTEWALDVTTGELWALPDFGRGSWENVAEVDTGTTTHVAFILGDDRQSDPLYLYVGVKDTSPAANFIQRNGLSGGNLYVWKSDTPGDVSPQTFNGTGSIRTGTWVPIDTRNAGQAGQSGYDVQGYKDDDVLRTDADLLGAFSFSRVEDVSANPSDGTKMVFTSTGRGSLYPADDWGVVCLVDLDFSNLGTANPMTAQIEILYDGDDAGGNQFVSPENGLRSPDNCDWADDGFVYVQEDRATQVGDFGGAGEEASIWKLDPVTGDATRVAQMSRDTVLPLGSTDPSSLSIGTWESSGIVDVSSLFGEAPGTLFLFSVQAHSITDGVISARNLVQGGQLSFLEYGVPSGAFKINPNTGVITVANPKAIDLSNQSAYSLRIQASDGVNAVFTTVTVTVNSDFIFKSNQIRVATYNIKSDDFVAGIDTTSDSTASGIAEVIQRVNPDVLLLNEFNYDASGAFLRKFQENYLEVAQGSESPVYYPYVYIAPVNTGIPSGFDLDNNGTVDTTQGSNTYAQDCFGFGEFPGQFGMVLLSKCPIDSDNVRTFRQFLWKDMPGAFLPDDPDFPAPADWYSSAELDVFRLSSKSHWDVPVLVNGTPVHILAAHPTPPVFDTPAEDPLWKAGVDHNGRRNSDEIRFWADYVDNSASGYIYDDLEWSVAGEQTPASPSGGLPADTRFVICGDLNADENEGDSTPPSISSLLNSPFINSAFVPAGGNGPDPDDSAGFSGGVRVDYVLPSMFGFDVLGGAVFWPGPSDPIHAEASDHHLVYVDLSTGVPKDIIPYYQSAEGLSGTALKNALHDIIKNHKKLNYADVRKMMEVIDESESDPTQIRLLYSNATLPKANFSGVDGSGATSWNREHVWPRSLGVGAESDSLLSNENQDFSDLHHLFPAQADVNALRSNLPFDTSSGTTVSDPFAPESTADADSFEPLDRDKGIVARALLYMAVRYDGSDPFTTDLELIDSASVTSPYMGVLGTLLEWNRLYPPSEYEKNRNESIHCGVLVGGQTLSQGNRNPFIDFPQFADALFLDASSTSWYKWQLSHFTFAQLQDSTISDRTSNPDGDSLTNFEEFLFNRDPFVVDGSGSVSVFVYSATELAIQFQIPSMSSVLGAQIVLETSTTLEPGSWTPVSNWQDDAIFISSGEYDTVDYIYDVSANPGEAARFWRVRGQ